MPICEMCPEHKKRELTERGLKIHKTKMHPFLKKSNGDDVDYGKGITSVQGDLVPDEMKPVYYKSNMDDKNPSPVYSDEPVLSTDTTDSDIKVDGEVTIVGAGYKVYRKPSKWQRFKKRWAKR